MVTQKQCCKITQSISTIVKHIPDITKLHYPDQIAMKRGI